MFSWSLFYIKRFLYFTQVSYFKEIYSLVFPKKLIYWKEILSFWRSFWAYFPKNSQRVFFLWYLIFKGLSSCFAPQSHLFWGWKCTFGYNCQSVKYTCGGELGWLGLTETWWPWNLTGNWALGNNLLSKGTVHSSWNSSRGLTIHCVCENECLRFFQKIKRCFSSVLQNGFVERRYLYYIGQKRCNF